MTIEADLTVYHDPYAKDPSAELAALILRRDELRFHVAEELRIEYMMKVGAKELAVWRKSIEYRKMRRKLSKYRAYMNRGEQPDEDRIEEELAKEFEDYEERIRERTEEMKELLHRMDCEMLTPDETKELRDMYTKVVKRLHPDLNQGADQKDIDMYCAAVDAYKNGNLDKMRAIYWTVVDDREVIIPETDIKARILEVKAEIDMILKSFPFDEREFLKDEEAVAERNRELDEMMGEYEEQIVLIRNSAARMGVMM